MMLLLKRPFARALVLLSLALIGSGLPSLAQVVSPPPPAEYRVGVRYHILSGGQIHVARFREMVKFLEQQGFKKDPGTENEEEDPEQTRITGAIAADRARQLLRERHVQSILLVPAGFDLAAQGDKPVKVQLELAGRLPLQRQRLLSEQVVDLLRPLGFQEAVGYDNRGHTRIVGAIPASAAAALLEDLRWHGSGWLAPRVPVAELPLPIRDSWPVAVVEVLPEPPGTPAAQPAAQPAPPAAGPLLKISPALRALAKQQQPVRLEVILISEPTVVDTSWRRDLLQAAPGGAIEGRLGSVVTLRAAPADAGSLAALTGVTGIRLPSVALWQPAPVPSDSSNEEALQRSGLDRLHAAHHRGQKIRLAIIDSDFRGYQRFVGKQLPAGMDYLDLAAECDPDLQSRIVSTDTTAVGHGTQCALAAALAAPEADFTLIRIDADAAFQLGEAARYINGDPVFSPSLQARSAELEAEALRLSRRRDELLQERKAVLDEFGDDEASRKRRAALAANEAALDKEEKALHQRDQRFISLTRALRGLQGIQIAACGLVWNEGYPVDGGSALSRYFDAANFKSSLWFQSVGNTQGQAWGGLFRDVDGNGVMEFAPPTAPLLAGRWTSELNFLGWQPLSGNAVPDLPRTKLRLAIQWREPHDPSYWRNGEDPYLTPLANLRLVVLRQRDPGGAKLPTDDLEVVAASVGLPLRIQNEPAWAVYEQTVEFNAAAPGRYALRVEGRVPRSIRPLSQPAMRGMEVAWELRPRIFVNALDDAARAAGRAVFYDYATATGNPGMAADAQGVISVGAADFSGKPRPYTAAGPPLGQELRVKPDVFSYDGLSLPVLGTSSTGTNLASGFAAGAAATMLSAKTAPEAIVRDIRLQPGRPFPVH
jgi:hypothetical protein